MKLFRLAVLTLLAAGAFAGCSTIQEMTAPEPPKITKVAPRKPATRELGSLWSEDSMWNHVYTSSAARVVGDIITVRLDEAFKGRLARLKEGGETEAVAKEAGKGAERALASTSDALSSMGDKVNLNDLVLRGSIEELGQRGVYRITAQDTLRMGGWEPYIVLKGRVRDRDIDGNDEIRIADIVDLSFELLNNPPDMGGRKDSNVSW